MVRHITAMFCALLFSSVTGVGAKRKGHHESRKASGSWEHNTVRSWEENRITIPALGRHDAKGGQGCGTPPFAPVLRGPMGNETLGEAVGLVGRFSKGLGHYAPLLLPVQTRETLAIVAQIARFNNSAFKRAAKRGGWTQHNNPADGETYWYNEMTDQSVWDDPFSVQRGQEASTGALSADISQCPYCCSHSHMSDQNLNRDSLGKHPIHARA
jgi:hypothetical protein